jgi:hypothetical protein
LQVAVARGVRVYGREGHLSYIYHVFKTNRGRRWGCHFIACVA